MEWICVKSCYWGPEPGKRQSWSVGEKYSGEVNPCKHFEPVSKVQGPKASKEFDFMSKDMEDWTKDDMKLATKKQINEKFDLGIKDLINTRKNTFINAALQKTNVMPRS